MATAKGTGPQGRSLCGRDSIPRQLCGTLPQSAGPVWHAACREGNREKAYVWV